MRLCLSSILNEDNLGGLYEADLISALCITGFHIYLRKRKKEEW